MLEGQYGGLHSTADLMSEFASGRLRCTLIPYRDKLWMHGNIEEDSGSNPAAASKDLFAPRGAVNSGLEVGETLERTEHWQNVWPERNCLRRRRCNMGVNQVCRGGPARYQYISVFLTSM